MFVLRRVSGGNRLLKDSATACLKRPKRVITSACVLFFCILGIIGNFLMTPMEARVDIHTPATEASPASSTSSVQMEVHTTPATEASPTSPTTQSFCSNLADSLPFLTSRLRNETETAGLRRLVWNGTSHEYNGSNEHATTYVFPGLDPQLFRHKRIVLLGDSTCRFLAQSLQVLVHENCTITTNTTAIPQGDDSPPYPYDKVDLSEGSKHLEKKALQCHPIVNLGSTNKPEHDYPAENTHIVWAGFGGIPRNCCDRLIRKAWKTTRQTKPQILIVNMGLHFLHLLGRGRDVEKEIIVRWIFYEKWLQEVINNAIAIGDSLELLLFKTTNFMCDERQRIPLADLEAYSTENITVWNETFQECQRLVQGILQHENNITKKSIELYCQHGTFDNKGTRYLNSRIFRFFVDQASSLKRRRLPFRIGIFDDFGIQGCSSTPRGDGRHHKFIMLARLRLLANVMSCKDGWTHEQLGLYARRLLDHESA